MRQLSAIVACARVAFASPASDTHHAVDSGSVKGYTTAPDPSVQWGKWDGWGVSLCWWANIFGDRDDLADVFFSLDSTTVEGVKYPGLGFNIARYNAGGSAWKSTPDGQSMQTSSNEPAWKQIHGFWEDWTSADPDSSSWNWTDPKQIAMLQKARDRGADQFELFSNSPMWWMLNNHNPAGSNTGSDENLQSWNRRNHSVYLATVAQHAKEHWGVEFSSVEPLNEPVTNWWKSTGTQEGCHFDSTTQELVVQDLREELDSRGLSAVVAASDENTYDLARDTWNSFGSVAQSTVGRVNVHGYQEGDGRRDLLFRDVAGKPLWNSEYGDGDGSGMSLATNLNLDFQWLHNTAWCYWQALDEANGWGLFKFDSTSFSVQYANTKFYVLAQYSRHIRPGMTIIAGGDDKNTVAAYDSQNRRLVLVTTNYGTEQSVSYDLTKFGSASGPVTRWITDTAAGGARYEAFTDITVAAGLFTASFPKNSVQTFEIENVDLAASLAVLV